MTNDEEFDLYFTTEFINDYKRVVKKNLLLKKKFIKTLNYLSENPKHLSLKSHKVDTIENTDVWSSWVTET